MSTEIEIKYRIRSRDVEHIRHKLASFEHKDRKYEKNIMFDNQYKEMDKVDARLRVRLISEERDSKDKTILFTYKRRLSTYLGIKKEEEIEVEFITDADEFITILNRMGYDKTTSYERYRETYETENVEITLDEFPYGVVLELEGSESDILALELQLGLTPEDRYSLSCDDLYCELCKERGIKINPDILFDDPHMPKY